MRILFSNPPWWEGIETVWNKKILPVKRYRHGVRAGSRWPFTFLGRSKPDNFVFGDYLPYPFFMGYAATYVREKTGHEVVMRDSIALKESYERYFAYIQNQAFDFIFIESATPSYEHDKDVIRKIQELSPKSKIVVTGPIAFLGQKVMDDLGNHAVIKGEYEKGSVRVINGERGIIESDLLTEGEMNAAPFPYFDDTIAYRYWDVSPKGQIHPHAQIWASRGCPFKCIFCVWPANMTGNDTDGTGRRTVRYYGADYVRRLVKYLLDRYQFKSVYFDDDTFNLGDRHTRDISEVMKEFGRPWSAMCRADTIRRETWQVMKDCGCFGVKIGFESGNQYVVDKIVNKHLDIREGQAIVKYLQGIGMTVHGTFTFGLPGETKKQMHETLKFIEETGFDTVQHSGTAEIEGTPLSTLRERGSLKMFEGAKIDENYDRHVDGNKKMQKLVEELKNS